MCYYNPLHRSRRFINQYFRFTEQKSPRIQLNNKTNRNCLLGASSCASRRKVPRCVSDVRIEVSCRRDLNTDVSVLVRLIDKDCAKTAEMWGGRRAKSTNCDLSSFGPALFEIWWSDICFTGPYGPVKDKMHWPELVRWSEKSAGPAGQCLC